MDVNQIEAELKNPNSQHRLKAIVALKEHPVDVAVPILIKHLQDPEILVRTFIARELGRHRISESFAALIQMLKFDNIPNVRAEAANSLSLFGKNSVSNLVQTFESDDDWLVRYSILAALMEMENPEELLEVCALGLEGEDVVVQETSIDALGILAGSQQSGAALSKLLPLKDSEADNIRDTDRPCSKTF